MKRSLKLPWVVLGFGVTSLLAGWISAISYQNAVHLLESTNKSKQTYGVIKNLLDTFTDMTVVESGRRGYVFLDDKNELPRFTQATQRMKQELQQLHTQFLGNSEQSQRLTQLEALLKQRIELLQTSINLYRIDRSNRQAQIEITNQSIELRNRIQAVINEMQLKEEYSLERWLQQSQAKIHDRFIIEFLITALLYATLVSVYAVLSQQLVKRKQAETAHYKLTKEKEINDLKLRFFSMVSHEFRTPLSVILGSAQLLEGNSHLWTEPQKQKSLHRIRSSAQLMTHLLTDILTLSRAEAGKLEFHPEQIDLEAFCLNLIEEIQLSYHTAHRIQFISQTSCAHAKLDEKLLYSILSNLLSNSIKYSHSESTIVFQVQCESNQVIFRIQDNGVGIQPADQIHVFEPFFRGQTPLEQSGTGLGLAVVKTCVDLHQGEIDVLSEVGSGTTFVIKLPTIVQPSASSLSML